MINDQLADARWFKSSFSNGQANCVEVAFSGWRKSSFSNGDAECVEVAFRNAVVGARDSKNPDAGQLMFSPASWGMLVRKLGR